MALFLYGTLRYLPLLLVPPAVGVMAYTEAILDDFWAIVGVLVLFAIYLFITGRGLYIASSARSTYARLLAGSLSLTFFVYVLVNAGMVSGLLPVVGVPLPLISYGGTSIVTLLAGFGILMSIYGHRNFIR